MDYDDFEEEEVGDFVEEDDGDGGDELHGDDEEEDDEDGGDWLGVAEVGVDDEELDEVEGGDEEVVEEHDDDLVLVAREVLLRVLLRHLRVLELQRVLLDQVLVLHVLQLLQTH